MIRKMIKQPVGPLHDWDFGAEAGDRVYAQRGDFAVMYDLRESRGRHKRACGELTPCEVKKNGALRQAVIGDDGVWYWKD